MLPQLIAETLRYSVLCPIAWEPLNEPQKTVKKTTAGQDLMIAWHHSVSDHMKRRAPRQMTTTGYEAKFGESHFKLLHDRESIDFACAHLWVQNWGHYNMLDQTDASLKEAKKFAIRFVKGAEARHHSCRLLRSHSLT